MAKKNYKRRPRRNKRKKTANGFNTIAKIGKFIPPTMMVKLRYVEQISLDPSIGGVPSNYFYRMNSLFDPNYSGIGHRYLGTSEIINLGYTKYIIMGSRINVKTIMPNDGQLESTKYNQNIVSTTMKTSPSTVLLTTAEVLEQGQSRYHFTNQTFMKSHTNYFSAKKFFGVTDVKDNQNLGALVNGNPEDVCYCRISAQPVQQGLDSYKTNLLVTIDALVYFHDRQVISGS